MDLALGLCPDHVEVFFRNTYIKELRLWELHNSWGFWSISFQLMNEENTIVSTIMRRWDAEFTKNGPTYFVLAPGERREISLRLNDGWWQRDQINSSLKDKNLSVRAIYRVDPSPEADDNNVFTGTTVSEWVVSNPPHSWLLTQTKDTEEIARWLLGYRPEEILSRFRNKIEENVWHIELNAKRLNEDLGASSTPLNNMSSGTTVGHLVNSILEYAEEIHKTIRETSAYFETKASLATSDETETKNQD